DRPDTNASCAVRPRSTIAPQSLLLLNSEDSLAAATELAALALVEGKSTGGQIATIYRRTLGRDPSKEEAARADEFLAERIASFEAGKPAKRFTRRAAQLGDT